MRRNLWTVSLKMMCAILFAGVLGFLTPLPTVAQDQILPLKIKVAEKAPNFELPSAEGKTVSLSDYLGHNVLIDFYRGYW
jgi:cytochrome oxidase Cu insertion factor (SCO1/SenC/PrrC family)